MDIKKRQKNADFFLCEICKFTCSKQSEWLRHTTRPKHKNNINDIKKTPKNAYSCGDCGKIYKFYSGLWKHKQLCNHKQICNHNLNNIIITDEIKICEKNILSNSDDKINLITNLIIEVVKNNKELQKQTQEFQEKMLDVCKNTNHISNSNNTMNNSNNKTFNLQVFLNEQCKDALNLSDFIESIQLNLSDLENMEKLGYTDCMFNNIFGNMNILDICSRPFHCSDLKREIMYIKDNDIWEKEDADHSKLKNAIRSIEKKNFKLLNEWTNKHPTFKDYDSPYNDKYLKIVGQTMSGDKEHMIKVIRKLAKNSVIDKNSL